MGELQAWLSDAFDPTDPDTLLWQVTGGNYRLVKDPVRYLPAFRQAIMTLPDSLTRRCIRRARILAGVCPICMADLPLQRSRAKQRSLGAHVWDCATCGWFHVQTKHELEALLREPGIRGLEAEVAGPRRPESALEYVRAIAGDLIESGSKALYRLLSPLVMLLPWLALLYLTVRVFGVGF